MYGFNISVDAVNYDQFSIIIKLNDDKLRTEFEFLSLLQRDYKIHQQVVREILSPDYNLFAGINWINQSDVDVKGAFDCLRNLVKKLKTIYAKVREEINVDANADISDVLITKVLMGTLGCVTAYDRFFTYAIKYLNIAEGTFNIKTMRSMKNLIKFYNSHKDALDNICKKMQIEGCEQINYPPMKIIDMGFWQIGMALDLEIEKWKKTSERENARILF